MTIKFNPDDHVIGMWFATPADPVNRDSDLMGVISKPKDGPWEACWRFRYYNSSDAFDSNDDKYWYGFKADASTSEDELKQQFTSVVEALCFITGGEYQFIEGGCDGETFVKILQNSNHEFIHTKKVEPGTPEYDKYVGDADAI